MKLQDKAQWLSATTVALGMMLAGCGGLGDGRGPVDALIQPLGGVAGASSTKAFTCINTGIALFVDFSDGSRGDFTSRATYTSSNPAVARVSNFDIPVPEQTNAFYNRGTIIAVAPGTATITANYLTFTRSIEVVVSAAQNLRITPAEADLAANSRLDLAATAELDGVATPVDPAVQWSFASPNTAVATIDATSGTITGVAAGTGLTAKVRIPGCDLTAEAPVTVANLQSLALTREFGEQDSLVIGTTQRVIATGTLDNGKTQDLSSQVSYSSSNTSALALLAGGIPNLALAIQASTPVQVSASFASPSVTAPAIAITPVADSLNSVSVSPASVDVVAGQGTSLKATGLFASGRSQEITRHVTWTSSNSAVAAVQSSSSAAINSFAGLVTTATSATGQSATITATIPDAAGQPATATATVNVK